MSSFWRHFARAFVPGALLILAGSWMLADAENTHHLDAVRAEQKLAVGLGAGVLERQLLTLARDLSHLAGSGSLLDVARQPTPERLARLEADFASFLRAKPIYDQVRWLDASGQEIVRVDLGTDGPRVIPREQLQNKADRYYFSATLQGAAGVVHLSPLDLNVERGQVEQPPKPMLRIATAVAGPGGEKQGIVVLNFLGRDLLERFEAVTDRFGRHFMLLNGDGYWLHAPDPADAWGFMFGDPGRSLAQRQPGSWQRMAADDGQFIDSAGLWTFTTVRPLATEGLHLQPMTADAQQTPAAYRWIVASRLPPERLAGINREQRQGILRYAGFLFVLLAAGSAALARHQLREAAGEARFHAVFDHAMVGMGTAGSNGRWLSVNPALCSMLGYSADELLEMRWPELTHPEDLPANLEQFEATLRGAQDGYTITKRYLRKDGSTIHAAITAQAVRRPDRSVEYFVVIVENISDRLAYEQRLALQVRRSAVLLELPQRAASLSGEALLEHALGQVRELTNSPLGQIRLVDEAAAQGDAADGPPLAGVQLRRLRVPVLDGGRVRLLLELGDKPDEYDPMDVETAQLIGSETWRILERQRSEGALRAAMEVVNASPVVCFRWQAREGWPVVYVSDNVRQWGYEPADLLDGRPPFADLVHPDDLPRIVAEVSHNTTAGIDGYEQEYRLVTANEQVIWVVDRTRIIRRPDGSPAFYDGVLTDITERKARQLELTAALERQRQLNKRLEEANNQLMQSEKMASIGQLAAGVAHELNNPIGFVHSNLGTLDGYLHDLMTLIEAYEKLAAEQGDEPHRAAIARLQADLDFAYVREDIFNLVAESKEGLGRVKKIVQDLKSFSRVGEAEWKAADLHQGLDSTLNIVWNELKYKCEVIKDYGDIPEVYCLVSQLNQVFMNLLVNASHAIEKHGTVTIRTRRHQEDQVCVEVSDTGSGIPPEHLNRIFDPFFTTKPVGKGTGLGLSLAYSIIERHHGRIEVDSQVGVGTTFRVLLPIKPAPPAETAVTT